MHAEMIQNTFRIIDTVVFVLKVCLKITQREPYQLCYVEYNGKRVKIGLVVIVQLWY